VIVRGTAAGVFLTVVLRSQVPPTAAPQPSPSIRVLADLSSDQVRDVMKQVNTALGVGCVHCHVQDRWDDETKPTFGTARNMFRMVRVLNDDLRGIGEVSCWTCHRGHERPARLPRPLLDAELARWPADLASAPDSQKLAMAVYDVTLGVTCDHCHAADWKAQGKRPAERVPGMQALFDEFPKYMPAEARTQCYMCHQGSTKPPTRPDGP
jgi:photosynthetic reaction center cytochrome c subunit